MSPLIDGTLGVINSFLVSIISCGEYVRIPGATSIIVRLMVVEDEPLALLAVIVYIEGVICKAVGVPQIVPLLVPKLRPAGSAGEIDQLEGLPMMACPALCIWPWVYAVPLL